jgi:hypothetical protein
MDLKQNPDGTMAFYSDQEGKELGKVGGPKTPVGGTSATFNARIPTVYHIPLTGVSTSPFTAGIANVVLEPNDDVVVEKVEVFISATAPSCSIDVGFASSTGKAPSTLFITGLVTTALITTTAQNGTSALGTKMTAGSAIAVNPQTNTCATFAGDLYITAYKA